MRCKSCSRRDGTHSDGCARAANPATRRIAKPSQHVDVEVFRFEVDRRPMNATAYSLLAELHESFGGEP